MTMTLDHLDQIARDVAFHLEVRRPRRLRGVDIKARALTQVERWIIGDTLAARRRIGRDYRHAVLRRCAVRTGLGGEIIFRAGEPREPNQIRKRPLARWREHGERHLRAGRCALVMRVRKRAAVDAMCLRDLHSSPLRTAGFQPALMLKHAPSGARFTRNAGCKPATGRLVLFSAVFLEAIHQLGVCVRLREDFIAVVVPAE